MSAAAADGRYADVAAQLSQGTRLGAVILMPAAALYIALGKPLAITLFGFGNYSHRDAVATGWVVVAAGLGLVPFAISQMQTSAFYALRDTRTPALVNFPVVAIRLAIDFAFYLLLPAAWVTASLMGGTAVSFIVAFVIGYWLLRRRIGRLGLREVASTLLRLGIAAAVAAVPAAGVAWALARVLGDSWVGNAVQLAVGGLVLVVVYLVLASALRVREVRQLAGQIRAKVRR
jgi:putative peptidoglycan lipid II flippase